MEYHGIDHDHAYPGPDGRTDAQERDRYREQEDGGQRETPDQEEPYLRRVAGFVQQTGQRVEKRRINASFATMIPESAASKVEP
jgi:hypothetical protein